MDKWIRKLESIEILDQPDEPRMVRYTNSVGDTIESFKKQVIININGRKKVIDLSDITSVDINPFFKMDNEKPYFIIRTESEDITFFVDTHTREFHDLPTVYDYIRRIVAVG